MKQFKKNNLSAAPVNIKQLQVETRLVSSFCFKTALRENETSIFFHIWGFKCSFFCHSSKGPLSVLSVLSLTHSRPLPFIFRPTSSVVCLRQQLSFSLFWLLVLVQGNDSFSRLRCLYKTKMGSYSKLLNAQCDNNKIIFRNTFLPGWSYSNMALWICFFKIFWTCVGAQTFQKSVTRFLVQVLEHSDKDELPVSSLYVTCIGVW